MESGRSCAILCTGIHYHTGATHYFFHSQFIRAIIVQYQHFMDFIFANITHSNRKLRRNDVKLSPQVINCSVIISTGTGSVMIHCMMLR